MKFTLNILTRIILISGVIYFLLIEAQALAETPSYLKGGKVTQHLNGKNSTYSSDDIALVNRKNLGRYKKLYFDLLKKRGKSSPVYNIKRVTRTVTKYRSNLVFLHLGIGKNGVTIQKNGDAFIVEEKKVPVLGLTYARHLSAGFYAGLSGFTNELVTGQVGYSW